MRARKNSHTVDTTSSYGTGRRVVRGVSSLAYIKMIEALLAAATPTMSGSHRNAEMSLIMVAPAATASRATAAFVVSTETGIRTALDTASTTGTTRRSSSS